ncbi:MAG TPA: prepilin-type N-terminal cleavage/methylation domain-containing protein [Gaiellaceae bacterium]|nr:prepilin-type N-terminal cleavage/methylation domain-containing protein [Gaiellaceae bacterium]
MSARLRQEQGFGLIELLAALVMISVGILAILLTLNSGVLALHRSAQVSTAAAIADRQMELYRGLRFDSVFLDAASAAAADATYTGDSAYSASSLMTKTCSPLAPECTPTQSVPGPDGRTYRLDTYVVCTDLAGGLIACPATPSQAYLKRVTVVVRKPGEATSLARIVSTFGKSF